MKRFLILLFVLFLLAGAIVGVGYVPFRMTDDGIYLFHSNATGWDPEPLSRTGFVWKWELLIPKYGQLYHFAVEPRRASFRSNIELPSASLYRNYLVDSPELTATVEVDIAYRPTEALIVNLAQAGLRPDSMERWYRDLELRMNQTALVAVEHTLTDISELDLPSRLFSMVSAEIERRLTRDFPTLLIEAIVPIRIETPDPELYRLGRSAYEEVQRERTEALRTIAAEHAKTESESSMRLDTLRQYGEVLTQYPILLDYLQTGGEGFRPSLDGALRQEQSGDQ